ncbi:MAG: DMT family transporter [Pseudomonadota bacterium]
MAGDKHPRALRGGSLRRASATSSHTHLPALLWVLLSTFLWSVIFAAGKFVDGRMGVFQITLIRYVGGMAVLLVLVRAQGGLVAHRSTQPWAHFARAVSGCGAAVAITWASANMALVDATAIGLSYGVLALMLGAVVLKETVTRRHGFAVAITLAGVAVVLSNQGAFQSGLALVPASVAFLAAFLFAVEGLLISVLGRAERALTVMLYLTFFGLCLMLLPALAQWQWADPATVVFALLLGPLALFGQYCTIRGYRSAPLSIVAPVDYAWLPFSAILGWVFFSEVPNGVTWLGCAVIVAGGILLSRLNAAPK